MKTGTILTIAQVSTFAVIGVYMVDINQTEEGALPRVSIEGGALPEFEAEVGDIEITEETVTVPGIEVTPPQSEEMASN